MLGIWELIMYEEDENGKIVKYTYEGECSDIAEYIDLSDCKKMVNDKLITAEE
tara:strand:+ start:200 stop:358 length:159 start_codon:yes stop_codon:yes gene_type:complete